MQTINFLYKSKILTNKNMGTMTIVKVFDPLQNVVVTLNFEGSISNEEITYHLITNEKFKYKHFQIYFSNCTKLKF